MPQGPPRPSHIMWCYMMCYCLMACLYYPQAAAIQPSPILARQPQNVTERRQHTHATHMHTHTQMCSQQHARLRARLLFSDAAHKGLDAA